MTVREMTGKLSGKVARIPAIDLFKFIILFFMIQGHMFRAYLLPGLRETTWYRYHEIVHGLVAPGFLFSSGFTAFLSYYNKKELYTRWDRALFVRLRRILFVILAGYWMHLQSLSISQTFELYGLGEMTPGLKTDILQCIGCGLLLFVIFSVILKRENRVAVFSAVCAAVFFLLPEVTKTIHISPIIDPYLNYEISIFPLFPWTGFLFLGVLAAYTFVRIGRERFFTFILVTGLLCTPWFFLNRNATVFRAELTASGNLFKIGAVLLLLWLSDRLAAMQFPGQNLLIKAGRESLFVYILHLCLIFDGPFTPGLGPVFLNSLTVWQAIPLFFLFQAAIFLCSFGYGQLKEKQALYWRLLFYSFWTVFFMVMIVMAGKL